MSTCSLNYWSSLKPCRSFSASTSASSTVPMCLPTIASKGLSPDCLPYQLPKTLLLSFKVLCSLGLALSIGKDVLSTVDFCLFVFVFANQLFFFEDEGGSPFEAHPKSPSSVLHAHDLLWLISILCREANATGAPSVLLALESPACCDLGILTRPHLKSACSPLPGHMAQQWWQWQ